MIESYFATGVAVTAGSACAQPPPGQESDGVTRLNCAITGVGQWAETFPERLARAVAERWPLLALVVLAVVVAVLIVRAGHRRAWRRAAMDGYWISITPPRVLDESQAGQVWRLLSGLARRTGSRRRPVRLPLTFEVHARDGRLSAGLWLPGWVPESLVVAEASRAWPGVRAVRGAAPVLRGEPGWSVVGVRLAARSDLVPLVDDPQPPRRGRDLVGGLGADREPLRPVFAAMLRPGGPAVLQVLVRPVPARRLAGLRHAARFGTPERRAARLRALDALTTVAAGAVHLLLDVLTELLSPSRSVSSYPAGVASASMDRRRGSDPVASEAMRLAGDKLADGPHLLATVRVGVARPDGGFALTAALSIADGFIVVSRQLGPVRLRQATAALTDRWAGRGDWLLHTATELGALAHLPADPARYRFDTAALHRAHPANARRVEPEQRTARRPGWNRTGWTDTGWTGTGDRPDDR